MKSMFLLVVSALVLLIFTPVRASCEITVTQNILRTDFIPPSTVKISEDFKYIGRLKSDDTIRSTTSNKIGSERTDCYIFVDADEANRTKRVLFIRIRVPPDKWRWEGSGVYDGIKNYFTKGMEKVGGRDYEYYVHLNSKTASDELSKFVESKGYKYYQCSCQKRLGTYFQSKRFEIVYTENIAYFGPSCEEFKGKYALYTDKQKEYIKAFLDRCSKAFQVSNG